MVTDGPIPFVPYMCGALAATRHATIKASQNEEAGTR